MTMKRHIDRCGSGTDTGPDGKCKRTTARHRRQGDTTSHVREALKKSHVFSLELVEHPLANEVQALFIILKSYFPQGNKLYIKRRCIRLLASASQCGVPSNHPLAGRAVASAPANH